MKCIRTKPCGDCPFRKNSLPGWIGNWSDPEELLSASQSEAGFPCHTSFDNSELTVQEACDSPKVHVCVGSLQMSRNSFKMYRNPILAAWAKLVGKSESVLSDWDFVKHHTRLKENKRKA